MSISREATQEEVKTTDRTRAVLSALLTRRRRASWTWEGRNLILSEPNWVNRTIWTGDNLGIMRIAQKETARALFANFPT